MRFAVLAAVALLPGCPAPEEAKIDLRVALDPGGQEIRDVGDVSQQHVMSPLGPFKTFDTVSAIEDETGYSSLEVELDVAAGWEGGWNINVESNVGARFDIDVSPL